MSNDQYETVRLRALELQAEGLNFSHAFKKAYLESLLKQWPTDWGDDYQVLLYGDFDPPGKDLEFPSLGIRVLGDPIDTSIFPSAKTVLAARISIKERSIAEISDAVRRLNILLGAWTLVTWGNAPIGWWSHLTHGGAEGIKASIDHPDLDRALAKVTTFSPEVRCKIEAALFWIREPGRMLREHHRSELLRKYSAYWNSFECLVEAVCILQPPSGTLSKAQKKAAVENYVKERGGLLTPGDIDNCYHSIVNPGFVGKGRNALTVCFGSDGQQYIEECFTQSIEADRLYNVRNAINHGDIDAENPEELLRVEARLRRLFMIVWGMFGRLVPFSYPLDPDLEESGESPPSGGTA